MDVAGGFLVEGDTFSRYDSDFRSVGVDFEILLIAVDGTVGRSVTDALVEITHVKCCFSRATLGDSVSGCVVFKIGVTSSAASYSPREIQVIILQVLIRIRDAKASPLSRIGVSVERVVRNISTGIRDTT